MMAFLRVLVYTPGIALILSTLATVAWLSLGDPEQVATVAETALLFALVPSFVAAVMIACHSLHWGMELDESGVRLVRACSSTPVSYNDVTFLRLGTVSDQVARQETRQPRDLRVMIEYPHHGRFSIWLPSSQAELLFKALHERCDHAAGLDAQGVERVPRKDRDGGVRLLTRKRLISGLALVAAGLFSLVLAVFGKNTAGAGDTLEYLQREAIRWIGIIQSPVVIGAGLSILLRRPAEKQGDRAGGRARRR
ncbi:MAG: hypothetical protein A2X56_05525 [Nitrospirae bacterium GWC2_57_13]|jgi:hypothetical protein|nr:MAG: hypothetical protein A2X56_05525 [Nitrospirae bacterium GWC2_57_13]HAR45461.1 hypothetical protein [Nitrospiraceae bacterium]HAS55267.1 hypothetical protein [Nitrospiraceae bacterium]